MTNPSRPLTTEILLVSVGLVLAVLGFAGIIVVGSLPAAWILPVRIVSIVVAPGLLAVAAALLLRRLRPAAPRAPSFFAALTILGAAAALIFSLSLSAGMDDADAGRTIGFLGSITLPVAVVGTLLVGSALAVLVSTLLLAQSFSRTVRLVVAIGSGTVAGIPAFLLLMNPSSTAMLGFGYLVLPIALTVSSTRQQASDAAGATVAVPDTASTASRPSARLNTRPAPRQPSVTSVRWMGASALAILAAVWGIGAAVGFAESGGPAATSAMGLSGGAAQLAAIPLIGAFTTIGQARTPHLSWRRLSAVPVAGVLAGTAIQVLGYSPDGRALFTGGTIAGLSIGVWLALILTPTMPPGSLVRMLIGTAVTVGGCIVWFLSIPGTGAVGLAVPALLVLVAGRALMSPQPSPPVPAI